VRASAKKTPQGKAAGRHGRHSATSGGKRAPQGKLRAAGKASRQQLGRQVAQEILKLRPVLKEIGTALLDRLEGELTGVAVSLDGSGMAGDAPILPGTTVLSGMLADIKTLKLKPRKGRLKDLRRLEALLESLGARIPPVGGMPHERSPKH
jgi:hypothetical protein